jgi:hypothetical protein
VLRHAIRSLHSLACVGTGHLPVPAGRQLRDRALAGGITAALASLDAAIGVAAVLTAVSGLLSWAFMRETHRG